MAEVLGLIASVASLIALTSETAKACNKLGKGITLFVNAPADAQKISAELLDLAQVLELFHSVLRPLRDDRARENAHVDFIERSLARIRSDVQKIADLLVSVQSKSRGRNTKGRVKWITVKDDVASMMTIIHKQKQELLMQVNLLNLKITHVSSADLADSRKDMEQIGSRVESLTESFNTSSSYTASCIENRIQSSTTSLRNSIRDEIHRAMSSVPRETNISRASLEALSVLVSKTVASQFESLASKDSSECSSLRPCAKRESNLRMANGPQTDFIEFVTAESQVTADEYRKERSGDVYREVATSRLTSRTSVQKITSFLGTMLIRRSTINPTFPKSDTGVVIEESKEEIDFLPAHWLRSWTGCGIYLARMGFGKPRFDFSFATARVVDFSSDPHAIRTLQALELGDLDTLRGYFQSKVAYPTDRNEEGRSLLSEAAFYGKSDVCRLLLQQGAGIDINTPKNDGDYPICNAIRTIREESRYGLVRLFLNYDADFSLMDAHGRSVGALALLQSPMVDESLFRLFVENEPFFDIHQRDEWGRTLLMLASGQTRQIYKELLRLGADASQSDPQGLTVLHHFFWNIRVTMWPLGSIHTYLDSGEILALLIRAGADAKAKDRWGRRPYEPVGIWPIRRYPHINITFEEADLAFWHQALRISGLCPFHCCDCPHHLNKMQHEYGWSCQSCRGGPERVFEFDTFEEEMAPALRRWDMDAARRQEKIAPLSEMNGWDPFITSLFTELDARRRKSRSGVHADSTQLANSHSESAEEDSSERAQTLISNHLQNDGPSSALQDIDSDERWETSSDSSSSDDDWESAPET